MKPIEKPMKKPINFLEMMKLYHQCKDDIIINNSLGIIEDLSLRELFIKMVENNLYIDWNAYRANGLHTIEVAIERHRSDSRLTLLYLNKEGKKIIKTFKESNIFERDEVFKLTLEFEEQIYEKKL